jgi:hypothetical protein
MRWAPQRMSRWSTVAIGGSLAKDVIWDRGA